MMEAKKARKIEPEEAKKLDRARRGQTLVSRPQEGEVQGQFRYINIPECPWCGNHVWIVDLPEDSWYTCCHCGMDFRLF